MSRLQALAVLGALTALGCGEEIGEEPPSIIVTSATATDVEEGAEVQLGVVTEEGLAIGWSASGGSFSRATGPSTVWTAPIVSTTSHTPADSDHQVTVTVAGGAGAATAVLDFTVHNLNESPSIGIAAAVDSEAVLPGQDLGASVTASDPEGDGLTFLWQQSPPGFGTLSGGDTATPTWTAPVVVADTAVTFTVTITDAESGEAEDLVTSTVVAPRFVDHVVPILSVGGAGCSGGRACHSDGAGGLTFDIDSDPPGTLAAWIGQPSNVCFADDERDETLDYIEPGIPELSAVFVKISDDPASGNCFQSQMPPEFPSYWAGEHGRERLIIESWILAGAPDN